MKTVYSTFSAQETMAVAEKIGLRCRGGEVFVLNSDIGGGKTTFTKGLAKGLKITDDVSSPSFTVQNSYAGSGLRLEHFDFYRLSSGGVVEEQLKEAAAFTDSVVAVEWGDIVKKNIPINSVECSILAKDDEARILEFTYQDAYSYLFDGEGNDSNHTN